ncbi:hypothetical protein EIP91_007970 [Steccherinum ochraceum]|uniref:Uncharacterized protein n=1 Tax=Steccherinum ochraceum TaxID=92696 RepID=A0A4R0RDQ6_9APHY|nr:hypothetical protein EIP91_007970 [Steccherinum ochraceum]
MSGNIIVGIAHSASTPVLSLFNMNRPQDELPFSSMILVEPALMTRGVLKAFKATGDGSSVFQQLIDSANSRRDIWSSREAAREWFVKRAPWKTWDKRVLDSFVDHGLRSLPTGTYPDRHDGVTLACTRVQEAAGYIYLEDGIDAMNELSKLCPAIPVHCILAGKKEHYVPEPIRQATIDAKKGRKMASVTTIEGAGHLLVQEAPEDLARVIWDIVRQMGNKPESRL